MSIERVDPGLSQPVLKKPYGLRLPTVTPDIPVRAVVRSSENKSAVTRPITLAPNPPQKCSSSALEELLRRLAKQRVDMGNASCWLSKDYSFSVRPPNGRHVVFPSNVTRNGRHVFVLETQI